MKGADIQVDRKYRVKIEGRFVEATALATKVAYRLGHGRTRDRTDGVRVRLAEPVRHRWRLDESFSAGEEVTIPSRDVASEWTAEHESDRADARFEEARKQDIERRLGAAGYVKQRYGGDSEGHYSWAGDKLALTPELTAALLKLANI